MSFKVAAIQLDIVYKDPQRNRERVRELIDKVMKSKPDIIILPETWTTGYSEEVFHCANDFAETEDGETITMMRELAKKYNVWFASGSILEKDEYGAYSTIFMIDRSGNMVGKYRKMHLYSAMDEDVGLKNGVDMPVFDTEFGKIALMTCYDIRFVELSRTYALRGAETIIVVSNWAKPKLNHWRTLLQARAIENQLYVVACNRVGTALSCEYFGHSMIIDPWGEIIGEGDEQESVLIGELDNDRAKEVRNKIPMFSDRQPHSYPDDILKPNR